MPREFHRAPSPGFPDARDISHFRQRHSEVPDKDKDWPALGSVLAFRDRVRARLMRLYDDIDTGKRTLDRHVGRMLAMTHEHEAWHVEVRTHPSGLPMNPDTVRTPDAVIHAHSAGGHGYRDAPASWIRTPALGSARSILERR